MFRLVYLPDLLLLSRSNFYLYKIGLGLPKPFTIICVTIRPSLERALSLNPDGNGACALGVEANGVIDATFRPPDGPARRAAANSTAKVHRALKGVFSDAGKHFGEPA
jgi:hypothetical protein